MPTLPYFMGFIALFQIKKCPIFPIIYNKKSLTLSISFEMYSHTKATNDWLLKKKIDITSETGISFIC